METQTKFTLKEAARILEDLKYGYEHKIITTLGVFSWQWSGGAGNSLNKKLTKKEKQNMWIAAKFGNPALAKEIYNCNPSSGKYNFHGMFNHKGICIMSPLEELMNCLEGLKESNRLVK